MKTRVLVKELRGRGGFIAALGTLFLALTVGVFLVLLIDLGRAYVVRVQLRSVADAASLSALNTYTSFEGDPELSDSERQAVRVEAAYAAAQEIADRNPIMGIQGPRPGGGLQLGAVGESVIFGHYDEALDVFSPVSDPLNPSAVINAVQMIPRLGAYGNPEFQSVFASLVGGLSTFGPQGASAVSTGGRGQPYDIVIVIDRSASMNSARKFDYTRNAAREFVTYLAGIQGDHVAAEQDRVAVVDYERDYATSCGFLAVRDEQNILLNTISRLEIHDHGSTGGTNHEVAFGRAFEMLSWATPGGDYHPTGATISRKRMVILLTDGISSATYADKDLLNVHCPNLHELPIDHMSDWKWGDDDSQFDIAQCEDIYLCEERALAELDKAGDGIRVFAIAIAQEPNHINCDFIHLLPRNSGKAWCMVGPHPNPSSIFIQIADEMTAHRLVR